MEQRELQVSSPVAVMESAEHRLVYDPTIVPAAGHGNYAIFGRLNDPDLVPWGWWGGVLLVGIVGGLILFRGASGIYSMWDLFWIVLAIILGAGMFKLGARSSLRSYRLLSIEADRGLLVWERQDRGGGPDVILPFEEVTEVVFGMTRYPLTERNRDVTIHAFTLLVRDAHDNLIPIIEASPNKEETHHIAILLGQLVRQDVKYVGLGIR